MTGLRCSKTEYAELCVKQERYLGLHSLGVWCADVKASRAWMGGLFEASGELREWVVVGTVILHVGSSLMASESYLAGKPMRQGGTRNLAAEGPAFRGAPFKACSSHCLPHAPPSAKCFPGAWLSSLPMS
jgi:hypothetical protein